MDFVNETGLAAGWCLGFQPDGRELVVVVVKATYAVPEDDGKPILAETQVPLTKADEFTGVPGLSAVRYETDYAHRKPVCDVLVNGSAYAPHETPAEQVTVGLAVGPIRKQFVVAGDSTWDGFMLGRPSRPQPFLKLPISYNRAYGGVDMSTDDPNRVRTYPHNPIGVGYYPLSNRQELVGKPLANTHEIGRPATDRDGTYQPMSFGPLGRNFSRRTSLAGTYDARWLAERVPYFPDDFDYRYFQCAPDDQQMPYPIGGEMIVLQNMTPSGITRFRIPRLEMPVLFLTHAGEAVQQDAVIDTILIEPDEKRCCLTWRASLPMRKSCFDLRQVVVGKTVRQQRDEARRVHKVHYANLEELAKARQRSRAE